MYNTLKTVGDDPTVFYYTKIIMNTITIKNLFLLPFLLFSITQCMKRPAIESESSLAQSSHAKPKTILEIKKDRDDLIEKQRKLFIPGNRIGNHLIFQSYWSICNNPLDQAPQDAHKKCRINGYSCLGLIAISVDNIKNPQPTIYNDKKSFIKKFLDVGCQPTDKDKEFALLEKWERCLPSLTKALYYICYINPLLEDQVPQELKDYIATLAFWAKFNAEESLL